MIEACLLALAVCTWTPIETSHYAPGIFDAVVVNRLAFGHVTTAQVAAADGFAAVGDCGRIGETVVLGHEGRLMRFLVVDCAQRDDPETQQFREWIAYEIDDRSRQLLGCPELRACQLYEVNG